MKFNDIESYVEFLAGYRNLSGNVNYWAQDVTINLASYDVKFMSNVAEQSLAGIGMTDKQQALALKLIKQYEKQMRKHGIEQPDQIIFRYPARDVNRNSEVKIADGKIHFSFPFSDELIAQIKAFAKDSQGHVIWDHTIRQWTFALTEYNLSWVVGQAKARNISVSADVQELFDLILEAEKTPYDIKLTIKEGGVAFIENAPASMVDYLNEANAFDDIYKLVDYAGVLSYTVDKSIADVISATHSELFLKLCLGKIIDCKPAEHGFGLPEIFSWAKETNRYPICVFNPNILTPDLSVFKEYFTDEEIKIITLKTPEAEEKLDSRVKLVYTNKVLPNWEGRMPLLISYVNLMHGATKRDFMNTAEKLVYYCEALPKR